MSCEAIKMQMELKSLSRRLGLTPRPFTPLPPRPISDGDVYVEGLASPATIDRDRMKFGSRCWMPSKRYPAVVPTPAGPRGWPHPRSSRPQSKDCSYVWSSPTAKRSVAHS
jgi:hypothetical protein